VGGDGVGDAIPLRYRNDPSAPLTLVTNRDCAVVSSAFLLISGC
jgi:hypothetical protein